MSAPIKKINITIKKVSDEKNILQAKLLNLVKLYYRLGHSGDLKSFEKETNDQVTPTMENFPFTSEERQLAEKFRSELLMCHIQKLPRDVIDNLAHRQLISVGGYHIYKDSFYMQHDLIVHKWDYRGAQKVIDTWSIEVLEAKIAEQTEDLTGRLIICHNAWHADSEELKPYISNALIIDS